MTSKPSSVITYGRKFSMKTLKSLPTSCFFYFKIKGKNDLSRKIKVLPEKQSNYILQKFENIL